MRNIKFACCVNYHVSSLLSYEQLLKSSTSDFYVTWCTVLSLVNLKGQKIPGKTCNVGRKMCNITVIWPWPSAIVHHSIHHSMSVKVVFWLHFDQRADHITVGHMTVLNVISLSIQLYWLLDQLLETVLNCASLVCSHVGLVCSTTWVSFLVCRTMFFELTTGLHPSIQLTEHGGLNQ